MQEEKRPGGKYLSAQGYTVLEVRLAGHATPSGELACTCWQAWLVSLNEQMVNQFFNSLNTRHKRLFWLENTGHSIVLDPLRDLAPGKINQSLNEVHLSP